MKMPIVPTI